MGYWWRDKIENLEKDPDRKGPRKGPSDFDKGAKANHQRKDILFNKKGEPAGCQWEEKKEEGRKEKNQKKKEH